jgi:hypothetical protein
MELPASLHIREIEVSSPSGLQPPTWESSRLTHLNLNGGFEPCHGTAVPFHSNGFATLATNLMLLVFATPILNPCALDRKFHVNHTGPAIDLRLELQFGSLMLYLIDGSGNVDPFDRITLSCKTQERTRDQLMNQAPR